MAWKSVALSQNGNTTVTWSFGPGGGITTHDVIVVGPFSGNSRCEITRVRVRQGPTNYLITVRVTGASAVGYRLYAEQIN